MRGIRELNRGEKDLEELHAELGGDMLDKYGTRKNTLPFPQPCSQSDPGNLGQTGISPRGIDREVVDSMLASRWGSGRIMSMSCSGTAQLALGWLGRIDNRHRGLGYPVRDAEDQDLEDQPGGAGKRTRVNISVHGHDPMLSEMMVKAEATRSWSHSPRKTVQRGSTLSGSAVPGNEAHAEGHPDDRQPPQPGTGDRTGALQAMVVDYQCIFPSLPRNASGYHTLIISTIRKLQSPGGTSSTSKQGKPILRPKR